MTFFILWIGLHNMKKQSKIPWQRVEKYIIITPCANQSWFA